MLDVVFGENHGQMKDRKAAHHLSILLEMAVTRLFATSPPGSSLRPLRKPAALAPAFPFNLLPALQAYAETPRLDSAEDPCGVYRL